MKPRFPLNWVVAGMFACSIASASYAGEPVSGDHSALPALEDALWEGELDIRIKGPLFSQYTATRRQDLGTNQIPVGFSKEKSEMNVDGMIKLRFQINELGETNLILVNRMTGDQEVIFEHRYAYMDERQVKKTRVKLDTRVQVLEKKSTAIQIDHEKSYDRIDMEMGTLRFQPNGRMRKRGEIQISAELQLEVWGEARTVYTEEKNPQVEEYGTLKKVSEYRQRFIYPISFDLLIKHRRKQVSGSFQPKIDILDPLVPESEIPDGKTVFNHNVTVSGNYVLRPLF